jgi:hypothetical protein
MPGHATSKSNSTSTITTSRGWNSQHTAFVVNQARNGEDANSILILFETEYPNVKVDLAWIRSLMRAGGMMK